MHHDLEYFSRYWPDKLFEPAVSTVRKDFLRLTERKMLQGVPYTVLCLLLAQAMGRMLDGYSGNSSSSNNLLYEAVGFSEAYAKNSTFGRNDSDNGRYAEIVGLIIKLQKEEPEFAALIERVLALDYVAAPDV